MMGQFQGMIKKNPERYLERAPRLAEFLTRLRDANKRTFMLTNNVFPYIDDGMNYLVADQLPAGMKHWTELFDVVMTRCRKPYFFTCVPTRLEQICVIQSLTLSQLKEPGALPCHSHA